VVTTDGKLSAQFEHTVAVTADGVRVLTLRPDEKPPARG
jgi:methionyl aminopeptidase